MLGGTCQEGELAVRKLAPAIWKLEFGGTSAVDIYLI